MPRRREIVTPRFVHTPSVPFEISAIIELWLFRETANFETSKNGYGIERRSKKRTRKTKDEVLERDGA